MNIYERAKERFDAELAARQAADLRAARRYEWEIDSLIAELPRLIPDGLDWHWTGDDTFIRSHRDGNPRMVLSIGDYVIDTLTTTLAWDNSDRLVLRVEWWDYENDRLEFSTIASADDPQWLSPPIFDAIYYYVCMTEENRG